MNKKVLMTVVLAGATSLVMAQKPTEGNPHSLELGMNLFNVNSNVNRDSTADNRGVISAPKLKYRYFISPNMAIRFGLGFDGSKKVNNFLSPPNSQTTGTGSQEIKTSAWEVAPGIEYHFAGTDRLSPYVGLSIGIGGGKRTETWTNYDGDGYDPNFLSKVVDAPFSSLNIGILAGADFYFAENFFAGAEFGYLIGSETQKEESTTTSVNVPGNGTQNNSSSKPEGKSSSSGFGETAAIRIGWRF